jgi:hypothetical protein
MADTAGGRQCFHCKAWVEAGLAHDCWTTTEAALTRDLPEHLLDAWQRLRECAVELGEQRIYASHNSIMFSRKACYFFVRPKRTALELCVFLGRTVADPRIRRSVPASRSKVAHSIHVIHRDQVEAPLTDWLEEAYKLQDVAKPGAARLEVARKKRAVAAGKRKKVKAAKRR